MAQAQTQVVVADMDEMVFENRERRYGAYYLRKRYPKVLLYSVLIACLIFSLIPLSAVIQSALAAGKGEKVAMAKEVVINMADLPPPPPIDENEPPPPPPPNLPPPQVKTVAFKIPEPTPEEELDPEEEQTIVEQEELKEAPVIGLEDKEGSEDATLLLEGDISGEGDLPEVVVEKEPDVNAFIVVEEEPKPVNMGEVQKSIGYPQVARDAGISGNVVVRVLVGKDGTYTRHRVLNGVHPVLEKAVEKELPRLRFTPAIQGGKPIPFWVNIPFVFKLVD